MTASRTYAASGSFTLSDARQVGAKMGADLNMINALHGRPSLTRIDDYIEEAALLLRDGYLKTVDFGFQDPGTGLWHLRLRYTATTGGHLVDSRPGGLPTQGNFTAFSWASYLTYTWKWDQLTADERRKIKEKLPFPRTPGDEPGLASGTTNSGSTYSRNGTGLDRDVFTSF